MKFNLLFAVSTVLCLTLSTPPAAHSQISFTGFVRNYNAVQTQPDNKFLIGRNRLRLDARSPLSAGEIVLSSDIQNLYSSSIDSLEYRMRLAYVDLYFDKGDLRIGRQIISWGRSDGAVITDILTPLDLSEFLTQEFSDIRMGVTAISYTRYFGSNYLQLVVNPIFNPNEVPGIGNRWFPREFFDSAIPTRFNSFSIDPGLDELQFAGRLAFRKSLNFDLDLGAMLWHYPNPGYSKDLIVPPPGQGGNPAFRISETYVRSPVFFYSGTVQIGDKLLLTSEAAFYGRRNFDYLTEELRTINFQNPSPAEQQQLAQIFGQNDDGFLKERPWINAMIGLEYELADWSVSGQFANEFIFDHDPTILQERSYLYATLRLNRSFAREKFEISGFGRYNIDGRDFWINPEITYSGIDNFEASAGTQLFGGEEPDRFYGHLSFKQYAQNSFGYLRVTAFF